MDDRGAPSGSVRLTPEHGLLLDAAVRALTTGYRTNGLRPPVGMAELLEVARQLRSDGARLVVDPHSLPRADTSGHERPSGDVVSLHRDGEGAPRLVDRAGAAALLRVSVRTVDRRVADGTVTALRLGRRTLFDPTTLTQEIACTAS